jgi:hypothetical protein
LYKSQAKGKVGFLASTTCITVAASMFQLAHAGTSDWGYEDSNKNPPSPVPRSVAKPQPPRTNNAKLDSTAGGINKKATHPASSTTSHVGLFARPANPSTADEVIVNDWMQLYTLVSSEKFTSDQTERYKKLLSGELKSTNKNALVTISSFWPKVSLRLQQHPDQTELFAKLFKALLRLQVRLHKLSDQELQIVNEALGPESIAVPGEPTLTEEAIDAYNDMACFLYEQKHPNKTIDASDNRTIMAAMICDRFKDAPSLSAKMSMVNFALTWAKFKILWANSSEDERRALLAKFDSTGSPQSITVADPVVESVLHNGPWSSLIYRKSHPEQQKPKQSAVR